MTDVEQWNADMDAWGLDPFQRIHHFRRLQHYHRTVEARLMAEATRWEIAEKVLGVAFVVAVIFMAVRL